VRASFLGAHDTRLVVLFVGRLTEEKGIAQLVPLCNNSTFRVVLVGGGHQEDHARALFAHTDAYFTGVLRGEDLIDAYTAADIFVFPSQSESFGLAPLEAMACGLPVVAPFVEDCKIPWSPIIIAWCTTPCAPTPFAKPY
jgi:phosphatidylinositol alpha 1,6-mannosyltransferase